MAQFAPQLNLYAVIGRVKSTAAFMFWTVFALSFYPQLAHQIPIMKRFEDIANIANVVFIILFFIQEIVVDGILIPLAERRRRDDFIDNSFGSRFATNSSVGYFDNDAVGHGKYKAAVNLFENCFFTYSLLKAITPIRVFIPAIVFVLVSVIAYYGFKEVPFALSVLQVLFSGSILGSLIKHLILLTQISYIQDSWVKIFQRPDFTPNNTSYDTEILRNWLQYETLISRLPADLPNSVFRKNNAKLTNEWAQMKSKYNIR